MEKQLLVLFVLLVKLDFLLRSIRELTTRHFPNDPEDDLRGILCYQSSGMIPIIEWNVAGWRRRYKKVLAGWCARQPRFEYLLHRRDIGMKGHIWRLSEG
jgi:hypothetical protein